MRDTGSSINHLEGETINKVASILKKSKGSLNILVKDNPAISISLGSNNILLDIHDASIFGNIAIDKSDIDVFDKLKVARKFGEILNNNDLSVSILRKGKKAFTLGRDATPTISSILTGSDDIHIDSVTQAAKLGKDISKRKNPKKSN
ncbi:hypothetical protein BH18THE1_BH18THE1_11630 [soil metagenome]